MPQPFPPAKRSALKKAVSLYLILLCPACFVAAQPADSVKRHIDTSLALMQKHSLYAGRVNWETARRNAYEEARTATTKAQAFGAIAGVYKQLNDHHGWFEQYTDKLKLTDGRAVERITPSMKAEWAKGPKIKTEWLGTVAYLRLPGMPAYTPAQVDFYANWLLDSVVAMSKGNPTGWIIDLRLNTGGNITPMMSGLAPFFEDGVLSHYIDRDGKAVSRSVIANGRFVPADTVRATLKTQPPRLAKARVAVLIGAGTASSAEEVALAFRQRSRCRLFGEPTAGVANATEGFLYNEENSYLLLTTSRLGDRTKRAQPEQISPQVAVTNNDLFTDLARDNAVKTALQWLK